MNEHLSALLGETSQQAVKSCIFAIRGLRSGRLIVFTRVCHSGSMFHLGFEMN